MGTQHDGKAGLSGLLLLSAVLAAFIAPAPGVAEPVSIEVVSAQPAFDQRTGKPIIAFKMSEASKRLFGELTQKNVGRKMELRVDGRVLMAPVIREPILGGSGQISDDKFTAESAKELAERINSGKAKIEFVIGNG